MFNLFGGAVRWMSKKQSVVALSTTEAEYMAATHASKEAVWLQRLCSSMGEVQGAIRIDCDSQSAIFLAKNPTYYSKTKHIDVQLSLYEGYDRRQKGVAGKGGHFEEYCRCIDKIYEL